MVAIPPKPPTKTTHTTPTPETYHQPPLPHQHNHHAQTVVHYTPNTPCHPHFTEVDCTLSKHSGGFATIDPRHAGDTPQSSAYGSNSPQATNKDKPHHHDKQTKTCRTRPTPPHHLRHRQQPHPLKHPISPRFHRGGLHFEQPHGRFTTIDPFTGTRRWPFQATTRGVCDHRPPTRRRHAATQRLW